LLFNIREEVQPSMNIKGIGDIYIIDDILHKSFSTMFLAYAPMVDKMYTFNCSDVIKGCFVEYVMFETSFDMIDRSNNKSSDAVDLMKEASDKGGLYLLIYDKEGFDILEKYKFEDLENMYIPRRNTYFRYNRELLNAKKG
jgi:hypothetical protein